MADDDIDELRRQIQECDARIDELTGRNRLARGKFEDDLVDALMASIDGPQLDEIIRVMSASERAVFLASTRSRWNFVNSRDPADPKKRLIAASKEFFLGLRREGEEDRRRAVRSVFGERERPAFDLLMGDRTTTAGVAHGALVHYLAHAGASLGRSILPRSAAGHGASSDVPSPISVEDAGEKSVAAKKSWRFEDLPTIVRHLAIRREGLGRSLDLLGEHPNRSVREASAEAIESAKRLGRLLARLYEIDHRIAGGEKIESGIHDELFEDLLDDGGEDEDEDEEDEGNEDDEDDDLVPVITPGCASVDDLGTVEDATLCAGHLILADKSFFYLDRRSAVAVDRKLVFPTRSGQGRWILVAPRSPRVVCDSIADLSWVDDEPFLAGELACVGSDRFFILDRINSPTDKETAPTKSGRGRWVRDR